MAVSVPCNKPDEAPFCYGAGAGSSLVGTSSTKTSSLVRSVTVTKTQNATFNPSAPLYPASPNMAHFVGGGDTMSWLKTCPGLLPCCAMDARAEANAPPRCRPRQLHRHGRAAARLRQPGCTRKRAEEDEQSPVHGRRVEEVER